MSSAGGARDDSVALRVATLNTWGLPWPLAQPPRRARFPHIRAWLERQRHDVVALQEIWHGAPRLGPAPLVRGAGAGGSGLALRTSLGVAHVATRGFGVTRALGLIEKGLLHVRLALPGGLEIDVINTHLQAYRSVADQRTRSAQVDALLAVAATTTRPVVLLGDFNFYAAFPTDQESAARIAAAGFRDIAADQPHVPTFDRPGEVERFDRIYLRDGETTVLGATGAVVTRYGADVPFLSDHFPVEASLQVTRRR